MGYTKQAIKGISWIGGLRVVTRIVSFLKIAMLARLLTPLQFGAFGVASLALSFLETATETGVNVVLVQEKEGIDKYINAAWVVSIVRGICISLLVFLSAPVIAQFFHASESLFLLQLISVVPLLRGFINPSVVKFQKDLQFKKEFWYRLLVFGVDAVSAVIVTIITRHPSGIVFGLIVGVFFEVLLSFVLAKPTPRLRFEGQYLQKIFHRGKWVTMSGIFNYLFHNGDNVIVGRLLGTGALGFYQLAYSLAILPISEIADVVSKVTFPVYTKISQDRARLKSAFLKTTMIVSFLSLPFGLILFFFPTQIVQIVFGDRWLGMVGVLRVLAIFGVVRAISGSASALFLAVGKQEYVTIVTLVSIFGLAITIIPLVLQYGIVGAAFSALIGAVVAMPFYFFFAQRIIKLWNS